MKTYPNVNNFIWCQEEPLNNGAYTFVAPRLTQILPSGSKVLLTEFDLVFQVFHHIKFAFASLQLKYVGRPVSAAPAVGVAKWHHKEHAAILRDVFA